MSETTDAGKYETIRLGIHAHYTTIDWRARLRKRFVSPDFVPSDGCSQPSEGSITPLNILLDEYYGDMENQETPYCFRRDIRRRGVV